MAQATRIVTRGPIQFEIIAKAELVQLERDLDGDKYTDAPHLLESLEIVITKDGKVIDTADAVHALQQGVRAHDQMIKAGAVAECGKVALTAEAADLVRAAISEAQAEVETPEIAEHRAAIEEARKANLEADVAYEQRRREIEQRMNP